MKKIKIVLSVLAVSCILSLMNVKASSYLGIIGVNIPSMMGLYKTPYVTKTTISDQYVRGVAIDNLTAQNRAVGARLEGVTTQYVRIPSTDQYVKLFNDNAGLGAIPANYQLTIRAENWGLTSATFSGMWILDDFLL